MKTEKLLELFKKWGIENYDGLGNPCICIYNDGSGAITDFNFKIIIIFDELSELENILKD